MLGASRERGDHYEAIAIYSVGKWLRESSTTLCTGRGQQKHGHIGKLTANLPLVRPEFTNHALVEIIQFRHISSIPSLGSAPQSALESKKYPGI